MANYVRSPKSGNDWTQNELAAYNIQVVEQSFVEFFNQDQLPPVPPALRNFCETIDRKLAPDETTFHLLHYLDRACNRDPELGLCQEAGVDNFVANLLETLGYTSGHRGVVIHGQTLSLIICGTRCSAHTDVCICDVKNDYLLLVQRAHKRLEIMEDPEPQLIAEAIAAYQRSNFVRDRELFIPTLDEMVIPGITLVGTFPVFYKIKVTAELDDAVMSGTFPDNPVIVYRHTPQLLNHNGEGMDPLENRTALVQYYQAFKAFV